MAADRRLQTRRMKFICEECGNGFASKFSLQRHCIRHTGGTRHICHDCGKTFISKDNLDGHCSSSHSSSKRFKCSKCGKEFVYKKNLKYHTTRSVCAKKTKDGNRSNNNFSCFNCKKYFPSKKSLTQHMRIHRDPEITCDVCGKQFKWKSSYKKHTDSCHR